jgi:hypothetical protein
VQDQESLTYWDNIFADWESSGLKQREYCNRNNIKYSAFKKWRYRKKYGLEDDTKTASMLPIEVTSKPSKKLSEITLTLPSEAKLFLSSISAKELKSVLSELGLLS